MKKKDFAKRAGDLQVKLNGKSVVVDTKEFDTGSVGWYFQGKQRIPLPDGSVANAQVQISIQVVDSKKKLADQHVVDPVAEDKPSNDNGKSNDNDNMVDDTPINDTPANDTPAKTEKLAPALNGAGS